MHVNSHVFESTHAPWFGTYVSNISDYVIGCFLCNCRNCQDRRYKEFYHPGAFVWHEAEKREALNISAFPQEPQEG